MDEPTSALSPAECERLFRIVRQLAAGGVGIVYISHRIEEVLAIAERVTVLRDGRNVVTAPIAEMSRARLIAAMVGRDTADRPASSRTSGPVVLSARNLTLDVPGRRGWRRVLHGVDFDLHVGEVLGIGGLLGSGRSEILETLFGAARGRPGGTVLLDGVPTQIASPGIARRMGLALVTEDRKAKGLHLADSIRDNVALPSLGGLARFGIRSGSAEVAVAEDAVRRLGVRCSGTAQIVTTLSGGNQQKVVIGKWLSTHPKLLILDEPTRGIDDGSKAEIHDLIRRLAQSGYAVLVISSEMPEVLGVSDRVLALYHGSLVRTFDDADALTEDELVQAISGM
jgi:ribose transport system ATP-binding protein